VAGTPGSSCFSIAAFNGLHRRYENFLHGTLNWVRDGGVLGHRIGKHLLPLDNLEGRARSAGRPGRSHHVRPGRAEFDGCSSASSTRARSTTPSPSIRRPSTCSSSTSGTNARGHGAQPWNERKATAAHLLPGVTQELGAHRGPARSRVPAGRRCPGPFGLPVQFVIQTTEPFEKLNGVASASTGSAKKAGCSSSSTTIFATTSSADQSEIGPRPHRQTELRWVSLRVDSPVD